MTTMENSITKKQLKALALSKILLQKLEHESAMKTEPRPLNEDQKVEMLSGDRDASSLFRAK